MKGCLSLLSVFAVFSAIAIFLIVVIGSNLIYQSTQTEIGQKVIGKIENHYAEIARQRSLELQQQREAEAAQKNHHTD